MPCHALLQNFDSSHSATDERLKILGVSAYIGALGGFGLPINKRKSLLIKAFLKNTPMVLRFAQVNKGSCDGLYRVEINVGRCF
jgi:hypothetical protein